MPSLPMNPITSGRRRVKLIRVFVLENVPAGAVAMSFADAKRMLMEMASDDRARSVRFIRKRIGL